MTNVKVIFNAIIYILFKYVEKIFHHLNLHLYLIQHWECTNILRYTLGSWCFGSIFNASELGIHTNMFVCDVCLSVGTHAFSSSWHSLNWVLSDFGPPFLFWVNMFPMTFPWNISNRIKLPHNLSYLRNWKIWNNSLILLYFKKDIWMTAYVYFCSGNHWWMFCRLTTF